LSIERRNFPQFFITAATPCPYLKGKQERKVFTHLVGPDAAHLNDMLSQGGFRRSQSIAYRPACEACTACVSVRVPVNAFRPNRGFRKTLKRNADLTGRILPSKATSEHYSLFRNYIDQRHSEGGMADMSVLDFAAMVDESFVETRLAEYRLAPDDDNNKGELLATALIDLLDDGISMIYSFYETDDQSRSLGTFMILDMIEKARALDLPFVYLGYWIEGSDKMDYKARFMPQERLTREGWQLFTA
jgi:arginyl-tRNA--protein-N-Asp/Glu arginylyltransferase